MSDRIILDEHGNIIEETEIDFRWGVEQDYEPTRPARETAGNQFGSDRNTQPTEEHYTPEPEGVDIPYNSNRVSGFEFHYGEIAFYGVVILCVYLFVFYLISSLPM